MRSWLLTGLVLLLSMTAWGTLAQAAPSWYPSLLTIDRQGVPSSWLVVASSKAPGTLVVSSQPTATTPTATTLSGTVCDVLGQPLVGANVTIDSTVTATTSADGSYQLATVVGSRVLQVTKSGYARYTVTTTISTTATQLDFKGDSGLILSAPDLSYVLACVNRWQYSTLSLAKVLVVINAWRFPT
jgi:hypothetical protein